MDGHYLALVRGKIDKVTDNWIKNFDVFVLVSAPLEDVWNRISNDSNLRDRALFPLNTFDKEKLKIIDDHQKTTQE